MPIIGISELQLIDAVSLGTDAVMAPTPFSVAYIVKLKKIINFCGAPAPARKIMRRLAALVPQH
jgi:hypothetical protein